MTEERIMQGGIDCGPKDEQMTEIGKMAQRIDGYLTDIEGLLAGTRYDDVAANIASIRHKTASIRHMTNYEHKCTTCSLSGLMLAGLECRNVEIKRLRAELAKIAAISQRSET